MKKIAVANMKGGVGKTTTAIILSDALSAVAGQKVLALDLDSQANFSWALLSPDRLEDHAEEATLTRWLKDQSDNRNSDLTSKLEAVGLRDEDWLLPLWRRKDTKTILNIAVSDTRLRLPELKFEGAINAPTEMTLTNRLRESLNTLAPNHDYLVMDCSPALSALTRAGLRLADTIIVPTPLNRLCLSSLLTFVNEALTGLLELKSPDIVVVATRVGASSGKAEMDFVRNALRTGACEGRWQFLPTEFRESVEYTRALDPPSTGPHQTLKSRYGSRRGELSTFLQALADFGVIANAN